MQWFWIALSAPFLWSLVNISDQYLVANYSTGKRGSGGLVIFSGLIGIFIVILIGLLKNNLFVISAPDKTLLLIAGMLSIAWFTLYLYALEIENISSIVPWFLTVPIFSYIMGYFFLQETLSEKQIIGSLIILLGLFFLSIDFSNSENKFKPLVVVYMLICCFMISIVGIIFKYVTVGGDFWISSFWYYFGVGAFAIILFLFSKKYRGEFIAMNRSGGLKIFTLSALSDLLATAGNTVTNYATLLAPVTMVYLVSSFQPAIVLFLTLFATKFFPSIVQEKMERKILIPKILAIIVMIFGSAVLFW